MHDLKMTDEPSKSWDVKMHDMKMQEPKLHALKMTHQIAWHWKTQDLKVQDYFMFNVAAKFLGQVIGPTLHTTELKLE